MKRNMKKERKEKEKTRSDKATQPQMSTKCNGAIERSGGKFLFEKNSYLMQAG